METTYRQLRDLWSIHGHVLSARRLNLRAAAEQTFLQAQAQVQAQVQLSSCSDDRELGLWERGDGNRTVKTHIGHDSF